MLAGAAASAAPNHRGEQDPVPGGRLGRRRTRTLRSTGPRRTWSWPRRACLTRWTPPSGGTRGEMMCCSAPACSAATSSATRWLWWWCCCTHRPPLPRAHPPAPPLQLPNRPPRREAPRTKGAPTERSGSTRATRPPRTSSLEQHRECGTASAARCWWKLGTPGHPCPQKLTCRGQRGIETGHTGNPPPTLWQVRIPRFARSLITLRLSRSQSRGSASRPGAWTRTPRPRQPAHVMLRSGWCSALRHQGASLSAVSRDHSPLALRMVPKRRGAGSALTSSFFCAAPQFMLRMTAAACVGRVGAWAREGGGKLQSSRRRPKLARLLRPHLVADARQLALHHGQHLVRAKLGKHLRAATSDVARPGQEDLKDRDATLVAQSAGEHQAERGVISPGGMISRQTPARRRPAASGSCTPPPAACAHVCAVKQGEVRVCCHRLDTKLWRRRTPAPPSAAHLKLMRPSGATRSWRRMSRGSGMSRSSITSSTSLTLISPYPAPPHGEERTCSKVAARSPSLPPSLPPSLVHPAQRRLAVMPLGSASQCVDLKPPSPC